MGKPKGPGGFLKTKGTEMEKVTKGEWFIHPSDKSGFWIETDDQMIGKACIRADAELMAAAPLLLTALKAVRHHLAWHHEHNTGLFAAEEHVLQLANEAIRKAEGK